MRPYYERGDIRIYLGDCRDILPHLKADVIVTDPPYNAKKNYGEGTDDAQPWPEWCAWWDGVLGAARETAPDVFAFMSQTAYRKYCRLGQFEPDWSLFWNKPLSLAVTALPMMPHFEHIAYWGTTRKRDGAFWGSDVLTHNVERRRWNHPTPKPLKLMLELVGKFSGTIGDPFCGSGTTLEAALILGKPAWGIEIEERHAEEAAQRLEMGRSSRDGQEIMPLFS